MGSGKREQGGFCKGGEAMLGMLIYHIYSCLSVKSQLASGAGW